MSQGPRDEVLIRTPDRRLRVFVSSTLGELAEERRAVSRAVSALRLTPVMFEVGARPYPPAEVYRAYLAQSDVFIGLYWQRYGQLVPGAQVSGLEEETQEDLEREAWSWAEQLLPAASTLDPQARAELAWAAAVLAPDVGDDAAALVARERLAPLLAGISDPFLHAVAQLAMAWILPIAGDFDGALREAAVSLAELRGQDEPVFTGMAAFGAGSVEMALGRYDDALRHLRETRDLAERVGSDWFAAGSGVPLGILAVLRGSLDEARALLDEAPDLSLAARSTPFVTLCLAGYAQLAFADGDPDRAALLEGAAEGLRRRVGLPAWPHLRRVEADLVARVHQRLGGSRFDQAFSAGSGLTQRDAVAIVQDQRGTRHP